MFTDDGEAVGLGSIGEEEVLVAHLFEGALGEFTLLSEDVLEIGNQS